VAFSISNGTAAWKLPKPAISALLGKTSRAVVLHHRVVERLAREGDLFSVEVSSSLSCIMVVLAFTVGVGLVQAMKLAHRAGEDALGAIRPFIASPLPGSLAAACCAETAGVARRDHRSRYARSC